MIKIEDGRTKLYQWDLNQRLLIEGYPTGTEVHFANCRQGLLAALQSKDTSALVVATYEEGGKIYADIPNVLLQTAGNLHIYIYTENGDEAHTEARYLLAVIPREKPSDYVYTETEVKRWETLAQKVEDAVTEAQSAANAANSAAEGASSAISQAEQAATKANAAAGDVNEAKSAAETAASQASAAATAATNAADGANSAANAADELVTEIERKLEAGEFAGAPGAAGYHIGEDEPTDPDVGLWIDPSGEAVEMIPAPATAAVGQVISVKAVDENGKPTEWEAVDMAKQVSEEVIPQYRYIGTVTIPSDGEEVTSMELSLDDNGEEFSLRDVTVVISASRGASSTTTTGAVWIDFRGEEDGTGNASYSSLRLSGWSGMVDLQYRHRHNIIHDLTPVYNAWGTPGSGDKTVHYPTNLFNWGGYTKNQIVHRVIIRTAESTETIAPGSSMTVWGR